VNLEDAYRIGRQIEFLWLVDVWSPIVRGASEGEGIVYRLQDILTILNNEKIEKGIAKEIVDWKAELDKNYTELGKVISKEDAKELATVARTWLRSLSKTLMGIAVVEIKLQTGLNPVELKKVAEQIPGEFITSATWKKMTDIEKSDISDAAKCLLLGTATPSVMVALRGAEATLRNFYFCKTKTDAGDKTWRQLTLELKNESTTLNVESTFIGYLDYIGKAKRNFAQHPKQIYTLREAVMIFMQVVSLVEDTYAQIN
jgi:hypothetical protein